MPFTLLQVGSSLKSVNPTGGLSAALTLPSGITLGTDRIPRFARFKSYVVVVNTPSRPLLVSTDGVVYPLTPIAPQTTPALATGAAGALTGAYLGKQTFIIKDTFGNIITQSDFSTASASVSPSAQKITWTIQASIETTGGAASIQSRLYRTAAAGSTYFKDADTGTNVTTYSDNNADASLDVAAAPSLGTAPDLMLVAEWAGRLWGVDRTYYDDLRYTEAGTAYGWYSLNTLPIPHVGDDEAGITALIPRRNALGVSRRNTFNQVTGNSRTNFQPTTVYGGENVGCVSQESVVVFNDVAYFLSRDGVYRWDSNGIKCISDDAVGSWFTTDTYFNRAMFWRAFAAFDPVNKKYRLHLATVGSTVNDRWVEFDLTTNTWWGPHYTNAFTPTCAVTVQGTNQQPYLMMGSQEGFLSQDQEDKNDWGVNSIPFSVETKKQDMGDPDHVKFFGELSIHGKVQTAGTLTVTRATGKNPDSLTNKTALSYDMTKGRQRLARVGSANFAQLKFTHDVINQDVMLYGYEVDPVNRIGRR